MKRFLEALCEKGKCSVSDDLAARHYMQKLVEHLEFLQERGVVTDVCQLTVASTGGMQITFCKATGTAEDNLTVMDYAAAAFASKICTETTHDTIDTIRSLVSLPLSHTGHRIPGEDLWRQLLCIFPSY